MKKRLISFLFLLCLLLSACRGSDSNTAKDVPQQEEGFTATEEAAPAESPEEETNPLLEDYLPRLEFLNSPSREYGESASYIQMEEDLVIRILYPIGEIDTLNKALEEWVEKTVSLYQEEAIGSSSSGESSELTVDYDSYLTVENMVTVKLTGVFEGPILAHPVDIVATFNADRSTGQLLSIEDILLPGGREALQNMVIEDAGVEAEVADEHILKLWALTPEGLEIILERGSYLPMSDGTVTLVYPYEKLEGILSLTPGEAIPEKTEEAATAAEETATENSEETATTAEDPTRQNDSASHTEAAAEQPAQSPDSGSPTGPMLALTFDDGPSAHTNRLLDIFSAHGGKGTFFVVGNSIEGSEATLQRMATEGHELGGHSWNHRQLTKLDAAELTNQMMNTRAKIYEVTGVDTPLLRPPYGSYNNQVKAKAAELGILLVNWSVDTLDWKNKNADAVYKAIMSQARDGDIILCHDLHKTTVDAMERVIPDLIAQGYQLVTVSELLSYSQKELTAGQVYNKR